jgi:hypothetical protein
LKPNFCKPVFTKIFKIPFCTFLPRAGLKNDSKNYGLPKSYIVEIFIDKMYCGLSKRFLKSMRYPGIFWPGNRMDLFMHER